MNDSSSGIKIFYSYSHDDETLRKKLENHLAFLKRDSVITWYDREIIAGQLLNETIQKELNDANIILLLISSSFLSSFYCYEVEMKRAMERHDAKEAVVVPVLLSDCVWQKASFAKLLMSPHDAKPINNPKYWATIDEAFTNVAQGLEKTVNWVKNNKFQEKEKLLISSIQLNTQENSLADYPSPSILFTGRKAEIDDFKTKFDSYRIFAIEGLGGAGKTQFAAKCIEEIVRDKTKIIWLNGSAQSNFDVFVTCAGYGDVLKGEKKTDLALYSGLKDLIEKDERVVFWDNYNDYEDQAFSRFLSFANQYLKKATIILITKTDPAIDGITALPIVKLEGLNNDALEYAKKLRISNPRYIPISDSDLEKICIGVEGHPLAIEFSMWLMGYGKTADDIMLHMPEFSGIKKVEDFSKRLFLDIFNHPRTSDEERECFLKCSVFKERIKVDEINYLHDGKDVFHLLAGLIDKLLISYKSGFYEIHPLIRSFSYEKLVDKKSIHRKAAEYFISQRQVILNSALEEKIFYHLSEAKEYETVADSIESLGRKLIEQGQLGMLNEFMNKLISSGISRPPFEVFFGDIAQIKTEWDKAIFHFDKARQNTEDKSLIAESTIKYGEILFRRGDIKESLTYFEESYKFSKEHCLTKEEARALNDIGIVYISFGKSDIAYDYLIRALKIRKSINDEEGIASTYNNLGVLYSNKEKNIKALEFYYKSLKINEECNNNTQVAVNLTNIGSVLRKQHKLNEALEKVLTALQSLEEIGDKEGISTCLNLIGVIYVDHNQRSQALLKYEESLKICEEIGDKHGIAICYQNIGSYYYENNQFEESLDFLFRSLHIHIKTGSKQDQIDINNLLAVIIDNIGKARFKEIAVFVYDKLDIEVKKNVIIEDYLHEPIVKNTSLVGRNDPCICGSGKKYKNCHGAN